MTPSEKLVERSFTEYRTAGTAELMIIYPKMRMAGFLGKSPAWVQAGKAPYDIAGYFIGTARYIGVEIKENASPSASIKLIMPDKKGTGLHYHQLKGLVDLHDAGGLAGLIWDNGGEWGWLAGDRLKIVKSNLDAALKAAAKGYPEARGVKSILWGNFTPIAFNADGVPLWMPLYAPETNGAAPVVIKRVEPRPARPVPLETNECPDCFPGEDYPSEDK